MRSALTFTGLEDQTIVVDSISKRFSDPSPMQPLLAPEPAVPLERALEHLSERVCRLHAHGQTYGLALPQERIPPGHGLAHRDRVLAALGKVRGQR